MPGHRAGAGLVIFLEGGPWTVLTGEPETIWKRFKKPGSGISMSQLEQEPLELVVELASWSS